MCYDACFEVNLKPEVLEKLCLHVQFLFKFYCYFYNKLADKEGNFTY